MRRGELWWAELPPPQGTRPILLLSRDEAYIRRAQFIVSPVTRTIRGLPTEVHLGSDEGLPHDSVVNLDTINMVARRRVRNRIGVLSPQKMRHVEEALRFALDLPPFERPVNGRA